MFHNVRFMRTVQRLKAQYPYGNQSLEEDYFII